MRPSEHLWMTHAPPSAHSPFVRQSCVSGGAGQLAAHFAPRAPIPPSTGERAPQQTWPTSQSADSLHVTEAAPGPQLTLAAWQTYPAAPPTQHWFEANALQVA